VCSFLRLWFEPFSVAVIFILDSLYKKFASISIESVFTWTVELGLFGTVFLFDKNYTAKKHINIEVS